MSTSRRPSTLRCWLLVALLAPNVKWRICRRSTHRVAQVNLGSYATAEEAGLAVAKYRAGARDAPIPELRDSTRPKRGSKRERCVLQRAMRCRARACATMVSLGARQGAFRSRCAHQRVAALCERHRCAPIRRPRPPGHASTPAEGSEPAAHASPRAVYARVLLEGRRATTQAVVRFVSCANAGGV